MNAIALYPGHFVSAREALEEIAAAGLHVVQMDVPEVKNHSHWHTFSTRLYILEGELRITDSGFDRVYHAMPGCRVDVPARVLHFEESAGYRIVAGMSVDPASLTGPVDLAPAML